MMSNMTQDTCSLTEISFAMPNARLQFQRIVLQKGVIYAHSGNSCVISHDRTLLANDDEFLERIINLQQRSSLLPHRLIPVITFIMPLRCNDTSSSRYFLRSIRSMLIEKGVIK